MEQSEKKDLSQSHLKSLWWGSRQVQARLDELSLHLEEPRSGSPVRLSKIARFEWKTSGFGLPYFLGKAIFSISIPMFGCTKLESPSGLAQNASEKPCLRPTRWPWDFLLASNWSCRGYCMQGRLVIHFWWIFGGQNRSSMDMPPLCSWDSYRSHKIRNTSRSPSRRFHANWREMSFGHQTIVSTRKVTEQWTPSKPVDLNSRQVQLSPQSIKISAPFQNSYALCVYIYIYDKKFWRLLFYLKNAMCEEYSSHMWYPTGWILWLHPEVGLADWCTFEPKPWCFMHCNACVQITRENRVSDPLKQGVSSNCGLNSVGFHR